MNDTRLVAWSAMLDDIRTEAYDMAGTLQSDDPHRMALNALRRSVNKAIDDIKRLEKL